jgi:hypothetical protein
MISLTGSLLCFGLASRTYMHFTAPVASLVSHVVCTQSFVHMHDTPIRHIHVFNLPLCVANSISEWRFDQAPCRLLYDMHEQDGMM